MNPVVPTPRPTATAALLLLLLATALAVLPAAVVAQAQSSRNPCHSNRSQQNKGQETCMRYVLPKNLCVACKYRGYSQRGFFNNCGRIFWLKGWCASELTKYVELNPCDKLRAAQVAGISDPANEMGLDYFVYSVCEMCCDCVPMRATRAQFDARAKAGTLMKVDRANCPAHAVADICKVWPNVRAVYSQKQLAMGLVPSNDKLEQMNAPKVCDGMRAWKKTAGKLYKVPQVDITSPMRKFMEDFVGAATCRDRRAWDRCVKLERAQFRL